MATSSSVKPGTANEQNKNTSKALKQYQSGRKTPLACFVSSKTPSRIGGPIYRAAPVLTPASLPRTSERLRISLWGPALKEKQVLKHRSHSRGRIGFPRVMATGKLTHALSLGLVIRFIGHDQCPSHQNTGMQRLVSRRQQSSANGSYQSAEEPGDSDLTDEVPLCVYTSVCWFPVWSELHFPNEIRSRLLWNSPAPYLHRKDYFWGGGWEADTKYFLSFLP